MGTVIFQGCWTALNALKLLVEHQEEHPACKKWVMSCWHGYLSAPRCKWFAYGAVNECHCHLIISCFTKIQNCLTFLVLAYPEKRLLNVWLSFWGCWSNAYTGHMLFLIREGVKAPLCFDSKQFHTVHKF